MRKEQNLTQQELADKLGINRCNITNWECGNRETNFKMLIQLADMLNVSTDYLLGKEGKNVNFFRTIKEIPNKKRANSTRIS